MEGYTTNYVNLIADNLRERYDNGFPILKELIQNADDAKARTFLFARHAGFPDAVHPLLKGCLLPTLDTALRVQPESMGRR